jgi:hypothetical protein
MNYYNYKNYYKCIKINNIKVNKLSNKKYPIIQNLSIKNKNYSKLSTLIIIII